MNILGAQQKELCRKFGARGVDRFSGVDWSASPIFGAPVLNDVITWLECQVYATHDGGDHTIVVSSIVGASITEVDGSAPLVFFRSRFGSFAIAS